MKKLLHSKVFRKNLFNWLFMYIAVIGLFTSVVTYSKYISGFQSDDTARVAKFNASITYDGICKNLEKNEICNIGKFRPKENLSYYFTVDTTELEVTTIFVTRITILKQFNNIKIYDITETEQEITDTDIDIDIETTDEEIIYTLSEELDTSNTYTRKYKITMNYDYENNDNNHSEEHQINGAVTVGYSAVQKK